MGLQSLHDHIGCVGVRRLLVGDLLLRPAALLRHEPRRSSALPAGRRHPATAAVRHVRHLRRHAILLAQLTGRPTYFPAAPRPARRHRGRSLSTAQLRPFTCPPLDKRKASQNKKKNWFILICCLALTR